MKYPTTKGLFAVRNTALISVRDWETVDELERLMQLTSSALFRNKRESFTLKIIVPVFVPSSDRLQVHTDFPVLIRHHYKEPSNKIWCARCFLRHGSHNTAQKWRLYYSC